MPATNAHTHQLAAYTVDGIKRSIVASEHATDHLEILDVADQPSNHGGETIQVEPRVFDLGEAQAIADDYVGLGRRLGWTPMPEVWW